MLSGAHFCRSGAAGVGIHGTVFYGCIVIGGTVCLAASFIQVVILHTISGEPALESPHSLRRAGCYRQHNFGAVCIAGQKNGCYRAHNSDFFLRRQVVIHSTICAVGKIRLLLSAAHFGILSAFQTCPDRVVIQRTFPAVGLLSGAQFPNCRIFGGCCYRRHISVKNPPYSAQPVLLFTAQFVFSGAERLLSGAQFAKIRFFAARPAVGC